MKITLAAILPRTARTKSEATDRLLADYIARTARTIPCDSQIFDTEAALLTWLDNQPGRVRAHAILLDSRGQQFTSEEFAARIGRLRDDGTQRLVLAIGPADGWSPARPRPRRSSLLARPPHPPPPARPRRPRRTALPRHHHPHQPPLPLRPLGPGYVTISLYG